MGVKVKKLKPATPKITLGVVTGLGNLLPTFRTQTFADHQRIDGILKTLETSAPLRQQIVSDFFKKHSLAEKEIIDGNHPLSRELFTLVNNAETDLTKQDVAKFTLDEFNASVDGLALSFADRNFLMFWLVK